MAQARQRGRLLEASCERLAGNEVQSLRGLEPEVWRCYDLDGHLGNVARSIRESEAEYGSRWSFFYHVVEDGAIFQEINAALAAMVRKFPAERSMLSHLEMAAFASVRDAHELVYWGQENPQTAATLSGMGR